MAGKFIVFEGLDGSGITTQATLLRNHSISNGYDTLLTKEPTDGLIGGIIKSALKKEWKISPITLQILYAADRSHHLENEIEPALKANRIVVCDRYIMSSLAYGSLDINKDVLQNLNKNFKKPNLTIIIDTQPKICIERMKKARHHLELFENESKLVQIRNAYLSMKNYFPDTYIVDGNRGVEEVFSDVKKIFGKVI
ncbi:MAG: dTMP kinase [Candidatus Aenigmatarchaeota archaeon]